MTHDDSTRRTIAVYDAHAANYAAINAENAVVRALVDRFCAELPSGGAVLDVGCGPGRDSAYLAAQGFRVTGVDMSAGLLALARDAVPAARFVLGDMRRLSFPAGAFDGLWVCASLLHVPRADAPAALAGFRRLLRPGGQLYVGVKQGDGADWQTADRLGGGARFFTYYTADGLRDLLAGAGFRVTALTSDDVWLNVFAVAG
jgi:ubiquinone/menaquinone biosynthesis C-methylase UbiE